MDVYCPETCTSCTPCTCQDHPAYVSKCKSWKSHCSGGRWRDFVKARCPATCNSCQCCEERRDKAGEDSCDLWQKYGYCSSSQYGAWMWLNCYRSCSKDQCGPGCKCGLAQRGTRTKIVGGQEVEHHEWPWQATLVWRGIAVFCGGSVISDEWILTAAHCFEDGKKPADIQALLAEHNVQDSDLPVRMDISNIILHKDWNYHTFDQDFALLKMARKIDWYANPNIRPVCLPSAEAGDFGQWISTATGWGQTSNYGSFSNILLEVDLKVISTNECKRRREDPSSSLFFLPDSIRITPNMLCTEDPSGNGHASTCKGDSGGPLVACWPYGNCGTTTGNSYTQIGVTSFGNDCIGTAVFARVTAARQWIDENAPGWQSGTCPRV